MCERVYERQVDDELVKLSAECLLVVFIRGRRGCKWYMCDYMLDSFVEGEGANGIRMYMYFIYLWKEGSANGGHVCI